MTEPVRGLGSVLLVAATTAIAIHIVDDNFLQPEWGGSNDHLVSGLVPLAILLGLMWLRPRLRPGGNVVVTLALGGIGLMVATESLHHLATGSLRNDDWSGLLSAIGGAYLIAIGGRDLWRSRRLGGERWRRYTRRALKTVAAALVLLQFAYPVIESYAVTNTGEHEVPESRLGVAHEDVSLTTSDGMLLAAWYVPSRNRAAVLVFPGRTGAQSHARMLIAAGYGVLLVDRRGTGDSDGEPNGWGWGSELDVHAAVEFLRQRPDVDAGRIGGLGLSVGGELLLQAAAEDDGLRAVVSEGAGARSIGKFPEMDGAGHWAVAPLMFNSTVATAVFSNQMPPPRLHELVPEIHVPVFFINAAQGQGAEELSRNYYGLANEPKEQWTTESGHVDGLGADPAEYERRVVGFLDTALLG
jgi:uncharacterized protein